MVGTSLWGCLSLGLPCVIPHRDLQYLAPQAVSPILALLSTLLIHCGLSNAEWMLAMPAFAIRYLNAE